LSERVLGAIRVFSLDFRNLILDLYFTTDRVIVVKIVDLAPYRRNRDLSYLQVMEEKKRKLADFSAEELLMSDEENFAIPMLDIVKVTLRRVRFWRARYITIETKNKKYRWQATGVPPEAKIASFERFVEIVQPIFMEKLVVRKPE
jgi:hypothetical protein